MRIVLAFPQADVLVGNRCTADRWATHLRALGHRIHESDGTDARDGDLLIALHARRSAGAVRAFRARFPDRPIIVMMTGTDAYRDLPESRTARETVRIADRIAVLQAKAIDRLPADAREKARVVLQSATRTSGVRRRRYRPGERLDVCLLATLRPVKDPLRIAMAVKRLPPELDVLATHLGASKSATLTERAERETARNPRYRWCGAKPRARARRVLAESHLMVLTSLQEGGANVISEAIVDRIPIVASRIDGTVGQLGDDYPGYYEPKDTDGLADQLRRCIEDPTHLAALRHAGAALAPRFAPARERRTIAALLRELT